jgi:hypothetical protein
MKGNAGTTARKTGNNVTYFFLYAEFSDNHSLQNLYVFFARNVSNKRMTEKAGYCPQADIFIPSKLLKRFRFKFDTGGSPLQYAR